MKILLLSALLALSATAQAQEAPANFVPPTPLLMYTAEAPSLKLDKRYKLATTGVNTTYAGAGITAVGASILLVGVGVSIARGSSCDLWFCPGDSALLGVGLGTIGAGVLTVVGGQTIMQIGNYGVWKELNNDKSYLLGWLSLGAAGGAIVGSAIGIGEASSLVPVSIGLCIVQYYLQRSDYSKQQARLDLPRIEIALAPNGIVGRF